MYDDLERFLDEAFSSHGKLRVLITSESQQIDDNALTSADAIHLATLRAAYDAGSDNARIQSADPPGI